MTIVEAAPIGMTAIERLKRRAQERYVPQPFEWLGETFYLRRLDGEQMDSLVQLQAKDAQISNVKYRAHVVSMAFVDESGARLTPAEALAIGPDFCLAAGEFVLNASTDAMNTKEAGTETDEPAPFIVKPGIPAASPPPPDDPPSMSGNGKKSTPKASPVSATGTN